MFSIIVFSKDRPMQLHAYLESLFYFSDAQAKDVFVLWKRSEGIDYAKVISAFPDVVWVEELEFDRDVRQVISQAGSYIMFGVDDIIFTRHFSLAKESLFLGTHPEVFGFSVRLGADIEPKPKHCIEEGDYLLWDWRATTLKYYDAPWELMATLYRKEDIMLMLQEYRSRIVSPNYLEGDFALDPLKYTKRPQLACSKSGHHLCLLTVNRVQDTHPNYVDVFDMSDVYVLNEIYNTTQNRLDIKKIVKKWHQYTKKRSGIFSNDPLFGDARFFIFKKKVKGHKPRRQRKNSKLIRFLNNLRYLFRYNVKELASIQNNMVEKKAEELKLIDELYVKRYYISYILRDIDVPIIKGPWETAVLLSDRKLSLCRFGDGEFSVMCMKGIPSQSANVELARRLKEILFSAVENIAIGVPYSYWYPCKYMHPYMKNWMYENVSENGEEFNNLIDPEKEYVSTECSQMYQVADSGKFDFELYFEQIKKIFRSRDVTIICGETVFKHIIINIFDVTRSCDYLYASSKDAFDEYDALLSRAKKIDKERLIVLILGPTATVLAYDLAQEGYQALDFGHIAKDYDAYMLKKPSNMFERAKFVAPD